MLAECSQKLGQSQNSYCLAHGSQAWPYHYGYCRGSDEKEVELIRRSQDVQHRPLGNEVQKRLETQHTEEEVVLHVNKICDRIPLLS